MARRDFISDNVAVMLTTRRLGSAMLAAVVTLTVQAQGGVPAGHWPAYGGDAGSTKYSPLDQITRDNVDELRVVWE